MTVPKQKFYKNKKCCALFNNWQQTSTKISPVVILALSSSTWDNFLTTATAARSQVTLSKKRQQLVGMVSNMILRGETVEVPTQTHRRQDAKHRVPCSCFGDTVIDIPDQSIFQISSPSEGGSPIEQLKHANLDSSRCGHTMIKVPDQAENPFATPSDLGSLLSSIAEPDTPDLLSPVDWMAHPDLTPNSRPEQHITLPQEKNREKRQLRSRNRGRKTPFPDLKLRVSPESASSSPLSSVKEEVKPVKSIFVALSPVDQCSPVEERFRFPPPPSPAPELHDRDCYPEIVENWQLAHAFYTGIWHTDPGLMPPHSLGGCRVPRLAWEEVAAPEENVFTKIAAALGAVTSHKRPTRWFSSALPPQTQEKLVEQSKRHALPRREPFYDAEQYSFPVGADRLEASLEFCIMKEKEASRMHRRGSDAEPDRKRGIHGFHGYDTPNKDEVLDIFRGGWKVSDDPDSLSSESLL